MPLHRVIYRYFYDWLRQRTGLSFEEHDDADSLVFPDWEQLRRYVAKRGGVVETLGLEFLSEVRMHVVRFYDGHAALNGVDYDYADPRFPECLREVLEEMVPSAYDAENLRVAQEGCGAHPA